MDVLRIATAGSVDDGKSTLIGRLLVDSRALLEDQASAARAATARRGGEGLDLALLTDGLRAEREQGITIDVAYRYFSTARRKFIIADCPGHYQYTRNMVTGASTADVALVLIDVTKGIQEQTARHFVAASLLRVPRLIACINKMDLVAFSEDAFRAAAEQVCALARKLGLADATAIPISALIGDNVVNPSPRMPWYGGRCLLDWLETVGTGCPCASSLRLPLQGAVLARAASGLRDYRGYAGVVASGCLAVGAEVVALPSGARARVTGLALGDSPLEQAKAPACVTLTIDRELDLGRGDMLTGVAGVPRVSRELEATLCWFAQEPLDTDRPYLLRHTTAETRAVVRGVQAKIDLRSLSETPAREPLAFNEIGRVKIAVGRPLCHDSYAADRATGSFVLIDEASCATVAAGMIK